MLPGYLGLDHISLTVPSIEQAIAFYRDALGATELYRIGPFDAREMPVGDDGRDWTEAHVDVSDAALSLAAIKLPGDGAVVEFVEYHRPVDDRPPRSNAERGGRHVALRVSDLDAAVAHLVAHGARALEGPIAMDDGPLAGQSFHYMMDPCGNYLELVA